MGQRRVASPVTATTDLLAANILDKYGLAASAPSDARHSTLLTIFLIVPSSGRPSVDLGQRQRSFDAHAMFSRT